MIELSAEAKKICDEKLDYFRFDPVNFQRLTDYLDSVKKADRIVEFCKRDNDDIRKFLSQRESRLTKKERDEEKAKEEKYNLFDMFNKVKLKDVKDLDKFAAELKDETEDLLFNIEAEKQRREEKKKEDAEKEIRDALKKVEELKSKFNLSDDEIEKLKAENKDK